MRVMLVTPLFHPVIGGGETYTLNLAQRLYDSGHNLLVVVSPHTNRVVKDYDFEVKELDGLSEESLNIYKTSPQLRWLIKTYKPDVIHTHGYFALLAVGLVNDDKPVVASVHNTPVINKRLFRGFDNYDAELAFAHNTVRLVMPHTFIVGSSAYKLMAEQILPQNVNLRLMYYPVHIEFFATRLSNKLSEDKKRKLICVPSRIVRRKGIADIVAALDYLDKDYYLYLIGATNPVDEAYWQEVKDSSSWKNNFHRIIIPEKEVLYHDLPESYRKSSVIVMPSHFEGFGLAALEAMATKVPVIATEVQGLNEIIKNAYNGLLVPAKDPVSLAAAITRVVEDEDLKNHLVNNAFQFVSKYNWETHMDELDDIYNSAM